MLNWVRFSIQVLDGAKTPVCKQETDLKAPAQPHVADRTMRFDKFTTKLQEALAQAQSMALGQDNQYIEPQHLLAALLEDPGIAGLLAKAGGNVAAMKKGLGDQISRFPRWKARRARCTSRASSPSSSTSPTRKRRSAATNTSPRSCSARRRGAKGLPGLRHPQEGARERRSKKCAAARMSLRSRARSNGRRSPSTPRSDRSSTARQARPRDRARRRDPPLHPDPAAAHEEQPGADRRAGRGQDRDRRGPRPAHRQRRGARDA